MKCERCEETKHYREFPLNGRKRAQPCRDCVADIENEKLIKVLPNMIFAEQYDLPQGRKCQECGASAKDGMYPKFIKKGRGKRKLWVCYECK